MCGRETLFLSCRSIGFQTISPILGSAITFIGVHCLQRSTKPNAFAKSRNTWTPPPISCIAQNSVMSTLNHGVWEFFHFCSQIDKGLEYISGVRTLLMLRDFSDHFYNFGKHSQKGYRSEILSSLWGCSLIGFLKEYY